MNIDGIYSDIDIGLVRSEGDGDITKYLDENAVKQALINILTTRKGDRRMYPTFGASIDRFLFEPMDIKTADKIADTIFNEIGFWDDRFVFEQVHVNANYDMAQYEININYYIRKGETQQLQTINFVLRAI